MMTSASHRRAAARYYALSARYGLPVYAAAAAYHEAHADASLPGSMAVLAVTCILRREDLRRQYVRASAVARVQRLIARQIHTMCHEIPGRSGHAQWLHREIAVVKKIRDS